MDGETGAVYQELLHLKAFLQDKKDMTALDEFTDMKKKSLAVRLEAELLTADQQTTEELVIRTLEEFSLTIRKAVSYTHLVTGRDPAVEPSAGEDRNTF